MIEEGKAPCTRCGVMRHAQYNDNRTGLCKDCAAGRHDGPRRDHTWMDDAACTTVDPDIFFPDTSNGWRPLHQARQVCASCPVQVMCVADAPPWDEYSIRGGMTANERRRKAAA